jgi:ferredoxin
VIIRDGGSFLSEMDDDEETILTTAFGASDGSRLACQSTVLPGGPIVVEITEESRSAYQEHHARAG